ncbi:MAG: ATP-binding protein, partial [Loktanella sp.]|nr:ATP-binding protein [Loktanella sp.]
FWVRVDESQITAAIMNLISNGSDAIVGEGTITLSATKSVVQKSIFGNTPHELRHGTYVEIKVTDTGAGIPKDIMPRVIDPFFTTKPKGKGSGLGLSMVSGLAQRSGGKLWLESSPNGTQATIALPLVTANI